METKSSWKPVQTTVKTSSKFTRKITHVDNMMIHNLVKYHIQTWLCLWDIKITNFKPINCPDDLLEICYFYISQTKSSLDRIFYKIVYNHIIYMCNFSCEFRWLFCHGLHGFSRRLWFPLDTFPSYNTIICRTLSIAKVKLISEIWIRHLVNPSFCYHDLILKIL